MINLKYWTIATSVPLLFHYIKRFFEDYKICVFKQANNSFWSAKLF